MTDEKYMFYQDSKEKKRIAHGAMHQRRHCGKSGAVKFPSDFLSRKELKAMNGECKTTNLNRPMTWDEFKALSDNTKKIYIQTLREKFDVTNMALGEMFGIHKATVSHAFKCYGIPNGYRGNRNFDRTKWNAWLNGELTESTSDIYVEDTNDEPIIIDEVVNEEPFNVGPFELTPTETGMAIQTSGPVPWGTPCAVPEAGEMTFNCPANEALLTLIKLLDNSKVELNVNWRVLED